MPQQPFQFELYRLIISDDPSQFSFMGRQVQSDNEIVRILSEAATGRFDMQTSARTATYQWSVREFVIHEDLADSPVVRLSLMRLLRIKSGLTVTDEGIEEVLSESSPPLGTAIHLFFHLRRHLVAVEYNSTLMTTSSWLTALHQILGGSAHSLEFRSQLRLEPVPKPEEIINAFRRFDVLTRVRVNLRLPNPDLTRYTKHLYEDMQNGQIREFLQDMRNPSGLSKNEDALPFAAAAMAQSGYKKGEIILEGIRDKKRSVIRTGRKAVRAKLERIRDFARGIGVNAKSKEAREAVVAIVEEINRLTDSPADKTL